MAGRARAWERLTGWLPGGRGRPADSRVGARAWPPGRHRRAASSARPGRAVRGAGGAGRAQVVVGDRDHARRDPTVGLGALARPGRRRRRRRPAAPPGRPAARVLAVRQRRRRRRARPRVQSARSSVTRAQRDRPDLDRRPGSVARQGFGGRRRRPGRRPRQGRRSGRRRSSPTRCPSRARRWHRARSSASGTGAAGAQACASRVGRSLHRTRPGRRGPSRATRPSADGLVAPALRVRAGQRLMTRNSPSSC